MDIHGERENVQDDVEKSHKPRNRATSQEYERRTICEDVDIKKKSSRPIICGGIGFVSGGIGGRWVVQEKVHEEAS